MSEFVSGERLIYIKPAKGRNFTEFLCTYIRPVRPGRWNRHEIKLDDFIRHRYVNVFSIYRPKDKP